MSYQPALLQRYTRARGQHGGRGLRFLLSTCIAISCSGCANVTTISRSTNLPKGVAIHLDAQQRLVYSNTDGILCAEPSPDAIQSVAASLGAGAAVPEKAAASVAAALQQSTAGIGLRTQSITLLRDTLYRICEGAYNKTLLRNDAVQLLQRSQDLTLGALAIEQLTGAVVARQVILNSGANANASANIANTKAQLDSAKLDETVKKQAVDDAQKKVDGDNVALKAAQDKQKKLADDEALADDKKTGAIQQEIEELKKGKDANDKAIKDLPATILADADAKKSADDDYANAKKALAAIENNFQAAVSSANAVASGQGLFSIGNDGGSVINKDTAHEISTGVTHIVDAVLNKGHLTDTCMNLIVQQPNKASGEMKQVYDLCAEVIKVDLQLYAAAQKSGAPYAPAVRHPEALPQ
jgi:hypothetical protein